MPLLDEVSGLVFLVPFTLGTDVWSVRVKQTLDGEKRVWTIINATHPDGEVLTHSQWEARLAREVRAEAFWASVFYTYFAYEAGGTTGEA